MGIKKQVRVGRIIQPINCNTNAIKTSVQLEFKPGDTPWLEYGGEVLNGNVNWVETIKAVLSQGYTESSLAQQLELTLSHIEAILKGDISVLNFKRGARLLAIEETIGLAK